MATKPAKPSRKSKPKARPKAKPASAAKKPAKKKPAHPAAGKAAARKAPPKAVKKVSKAKPAAKKPSSQAKSAKPVPKTVAKLAPAKASAAAKAVNGKQAPVAQKPVAVKPAAPVKAAPAPAAAAPAHKPTASEIAAKLAGKRAEDAASKKGKNGKHADVAPRELTPADVEARKRRLKTLIVLGKERGYLTYAEINDHLPDDILDAEQIEGVISMIGDMGIQVYDEAPDADTLLMAEAPATVPAEDVEEEAEAAASTLDSEFGRTTDPVRMYMREMGSVELLYARRRDRDRQAHRGGPEAHDHGDQRVPHDGRADSRAVRSHRQGRAQDRRPRRRPHGLQRGAHRHGGIDRRFRRR